MDKLIKIIINIVSILLLGIAFYSFFLDYIYVWILDIGVMGSYKGYELALNFDGYPKNLNTLFPLLIVLGLLIYSVVSLLIKLFKIKKKDDKPSGPVRIILSELFFAVLPVIVLLLCLSTFNTLGLNPPKRYGGYYMGVGPYLTTVMTIIGGPLLFITDSGLIHFKKKNK